MWKRKELKNAAKKIIYKNYWTAIVVCFLVALLTGEFGTSIVGIWQSNDSMDPNYIVNMQNFTKGNTKDKLENKILQVIESNLNSAMKSQKYVFKIWDAATSFNMNLTHLGIILCVAAVLAITFTIVIADPLIVGGKKYFLEARKKTGVKVSTMLEVYKKENWSNIIIIMFLRNIYNALWYLTIVGGIIKTYEYRMIPYILAENPKIKRKEAFNISKQMMKGNKWRTFILDMSFLGWNFLSVLTLGILSILYVNPYNSATFVELYCTLKEKNEKEKLGHNENITKN